MVGPPAGPVDRDHLAEVMAVDEAERIEVVRIDADVAERDILDHVLDNDGAGST